MIIVLSIMTPRHLLLSLLLHTFALITHSRTILLQYSMLMIGRTATHPRLPKGLDDLPKLRLYTSHGELRDFVVVGREKYFSEGGVEVGHDLIRPLCLETLLVQEGGVDDV